MKRVKRIGALLLPDRTLTRGQAAVMLSRFAF